MSKIKKDVVKQDNLRVTKLREYLFTIIDKLLSDNAYQININILSDKINNYSLDKIPTASTVEKWITGDKICKDVFSFRSRNSYSQDTIDNLLNVGFFEIFENIIDSNNEKGILPNIEGVQSIECLNCGSMSNATTNTAEFDIQIQITYKKEC